MVNTVFSEELEISVILQCFLKVLYSADRMGEEFTTCKRQRVLLSPAAMSFSFCFILEGFSLPVPLLCLCLPLPGVLIALLCSLPARGTQNPSPRFLVSPPAPSFNHSNTAGAIRAPQGGKSRWTSPVEATGDGCLCCRLGISARECGRGKERGLVRSQIRA